MSKWIKKGDKLIVICGNDKGKIGEVLSRITGKSKTNKAGKVISEAGDRVIVQGVNIRKKHAKRRENTPGTGILEMEMPFHVSNVALCNTDGKAVRPKVRVGKGGEKELFYLEGGKEIALRNVRKHS